METHYKFEPYRPDSFAVPVTRVTPKDGFYVFTYFDVCPFSPSQRYLATTRLPQDRVPVLGQTADVCVIDLQEQAIRTVYRTKSWGFQTGALLNWGATDQRLYTNDVIDGEAVRADRYGVRGDHGICRADVQYRSRRILRDRISAGVDGRHATRIRRAVQRSAPSQRAAPRRGKG